MRQCLFALAHLVADSLFRGHGRLHSEVEVRRTVLVLRQVLPVDILQHRVDIHMPVEENARVRGVIEAFVRGGELLVAQAGYVLGIAAADIAVARVGIEQAVHLVADESIHIGKRALHLAEHDAVIVRLAGLAVELIVPALLHEYLRALMYQRAEHRVEIDGHEVKEILLVAAGDGIQRLVAEGQGIEIGLHRALKQRDERLLHREAPRTVQNAVLKDVEHARVVLRERFEADGKGFVLVRAVEIQQLRAGFLMAQGVQLRRLRRNIFFLHKPEAGAYLPRLRGAEF